MSSKELSVGNERDPILKPVPLAELRPTQMTVGMREVQARWTRWKKQTPGQKRDTFLQKHLIR
jgi:hypothetical protein